MALAMRPTPGLTDSRRFEISEEAYAEVNRRAEESTHTTAPKMAALLRATQGRVKRG